MSTEQFKPDIEEINRKMSTFLLKEALYFINAVPNRKYGVRSFKDSYELVSEIEEHLKKIGVENPYKTE
jgi:hypothetical protein